MIKNYQHGFLYNTSDFNREYKEPSPKFSKEKYRSNFRVDYARLMHSPAFRRLQGKTQLFPSNESDFFRNRLTHSMEVAQIAKSIAIKLNHDFSPFKLAVDKYRNWKIDTDLVEFAGLAHDLGHPPFGHNGEEALDECMRRHGGFEGNAQTLRILSTIEKKVLKPTNKGNPISDDGADNRCGLNLSYRSLAAILKYDTRIPIDDGRNEIIKGYYDSERYIVERIKEAVIGKKDIVSFKTIECSIMDLADDIAYSTYDLEDALKAGFFSLLDFLTLDQKPEILHEVTRKVWNRTIGKEDKITFQSSKIPSRNIKKFDDLKKTVFKSLIDVTSAIFPVTSENIRAQEVEEIINRIKKNGKLTTEDEAVFYSLTYSSARAYQKDGYLRTKFTSRLVGEFIRGVKVNINKDNVALSQVELDESLLIKIESLKNYTFCTHIMSPRLQVRQYRGKDFVTGIFKALTERGGSRLLPEDWQVLYNSGEEVSWKYRIICDYIAGMTDAYALEFYGRLYSENPQTIFKDH